MELWTAVRHWGLKNIAEKSTRTRFFLVAHSPCSGLSIPSFYIPAPGPWHFWGRMLMLVRQCPSSPLGVKLFLPSVQSHSVFLHFSVPLSLSRTFVVSRTEVLAAGSPGNSACLLFIAPSVNHSISGLPRHPRSLASRAVRSVSTVLFLVSCQPLKLLRLLRGSCPGAHRLQRAGKELWARESCCGDWLVAVTQPTCTGLDYSGLTLSSAVLLDVEFAEA